MAIGDGAQATSTTREPLLGDATTPTQDATRDGDDTSDIRHLFDHLHPPL
ncbi:hypothetical protein [Streptomyces heilongjiangensis]|uniref:Uncharacterized protein n=1 Tax=Streptomyces heilongjiangensis TaxID=945052 RepID=A0ABW1B7W7_9ACTN|nr:hypothetical protein [Streptomyces heilongjiangensis]MDC2950409.1 hypothetical protein [Streptomyces heilongjiangensis]